MDTLPNDVLEIINRKKFNLELLEHMKSLDKNWGRYNSFKINQYRRFDTFLAGDKVIYAKECHYVQKVCQKSLVLDRGRRIKIDNVLHWYDFSIHSNERFNISRHLFDTGSIWCHKLVRKYPHIKKRKITIDILLHNKVVTSNHPYAWLSVLSLNPQLDIKFMQE